MPNTNTKKEEEQVFYVGVKDPIEIRRSILESSKEMVQYLQRAERFKKVRAEKAEEVAKLKVIIKEISVLIKNLKASLPKTKLRANLHKHEAKVKKEEINKELQIKSPAKKIEPKKEAKPVSELQKLEAELGEIESRLTKMS